MGTKAGGQTVRRKPKAHIVLWQWRDGGSRSPYYEKLMATDAQRAIAKVKKTLKEEYSDVSKNFVLIAVYPKDW